MRNRIIKYIENNITSRKRKKILNKRGMSILVTVFVMLAIITIVVSVNAMRINLEKVNRITVEASTKEEFLNTLETKIKNQSLINMYETTRFVSEFDNEDYTIYIEPTGEYETRDVVEVFNVSWNQTSDTVNDQAGPRINNITYQSQTNTQQLMFGGTNTINHTPMRILSSGKTTNGHIPYSSGQQLTGPIVNGKTAEKVRYRVNEGNYEYVNNYPSNKNLSISGLSNGDIVTIEYLDIEGKIIGWSRYVHGQSNVTTSKNQYLITRLPNSNRIISQREMSSILTEVKKSMGNNMSQAYSTYNSLVLTYKLDDSCLYWDSYGLLSNKAPVENEKFSNPKYAVELTNSPCNQSTVWADDTINIAPHAKAFSNTSSNKNPWINGYHTIEKYKVDQIKSYYEPKYGGSSCPWKGSDPYIGDYNHCISIPTWHTRFYCSDSTFKNYLNNLVQTASNAFNDAISAWQQYDEKYEQWLLDMDAWREAKRQIDEAYSAAMSAWSSACSGFVKVNPEDTCDPGPPPTKQPYPPEPEEPVRPSIVIYQRYTEQEYEELEEDEQEEIEQELRLLARNPQKFYDTVNRPYQVPCIDETTRDTKLLQYERDQLLTTEMILSVVNNITADYEIIIEHEVDIERYPVKWNIHFLDGTTPYLLESGKNTREYRKGQTETIVINQRVPKNYDYTNMDLINTHDEAKVNVIPKEFSIALSNSKIKKITLKTKEFKSATYTYTIRDPEGRKVREKTIEVTFNQ